MLQLLHKNFQIRWERSSFEVLSVNQNRLLEWVLDWKITLMLHWGTVLLKQSYKLDLKFKENFANAHYDISIFFFDGMV